MRVGSKARPELYRALELHAHELLREVPLHDVWEVLLPGGGPDRTVDDVRVLMSMDSITQTNPVVRALFALRSAMGGVEQLRQLAREVKGATSEQSRQSGHMAHAVEDLAAGVNQILTSAETQHSEVAVILQALEVFRENTVESSRRADALAERVESLSNRADELGTGVGRFTL